MNSKYELNDKEYEECLDLAILGIFSIAKPSKHPTSFFIVGQPGAGKTGLSSYVEKSFNETKGEGLVKIDPDIVAIYHQNYEQILREIPESSYEELQKFVRPAIKVIKDMAAERHVNILSEGTFASTDAYMDILRNQTQNGYDIEIDIIAVHRFESLLSAMERQQEKIEYKLPPRTVSTEPHDNAYRKIYTTLRGIAEEGINCRTRIFRRGKNEMLPELVYTSEDETYPNPSAALFEQREQNLRQIIAQKDAFIARIKSLRNRIMQNEEGEVKKVQLEQLDELDQQFLQEISKQESERE